MSRLHENFLEQKQFQKALDVSEVALRANPLDDAALFSRGAALSGLKRWDEASLALAVVKSHPKLAVEQRWVTSRLREAKEKAEQILRRGELRLMAKCYKDAAVDFAEAVNLYGLERQWWMHLAAVRANMQESGPMISAEEAARAVRCGIWKHPMQRPAHFVTHLEAKPWWDSNQFTVCRVLEKEAAVIAEEARQLLAAEQYQHYSSLAVTKGEWSDVTLFYKGFQNLEGCRLCPRTAEILLQLLPEVAHPLGSAFFSRLRPGSQLRPHCGPTNTRLRCHLGLVVPGTADKSWHMACS